MKKHKHRLSPHWGYGGPTHRFRYCTKLGCGCEQECCLVEDTDGRWKNGKWIKTKRKGKA